MLFLDQVSSKDIQSINKSLKTIKREVSTPNISDLLYWYVIWGLVLIAIIGLAYSLRKNMKGFDHLVENILGMFLIPVVTSILLQPTLVKDNRVLGVVCAVTLIAGIIIVILLSSPAEQEDREGLVFLSSACGEYKIFSDNCVLRPNSKKVVIPQIDEYIYVSGKIKEFNVQDIKLVGINGKIDLKPEKKMDKLYRYKVEDLVNYCKKRCLPLEFKLIIKTKE